MFIYMYFDSSFGIKKKYEFIFCCPEHSSICEILVQGIKIHVLFQLHNAKMKIL